MKSPDKTFGIVRLGTAVPRMKVADPAFNAGVIIPLMGQGNAQGIDILVFPELSLTGYTCGDLFHQKRLQQGALIALDRVREVSRHIRSIVLVGLPLAVDDKLFNCAAVIHRGEILGIVPKSFVPGYKEFYEPRWFSPASANTKSFVRVNGVDVPFGTDLLFKATDFPDLIFGAEICEDVWVPVPPSVLQSLAGAVIGLNLSASNERIGKAPYRRMLVPSHAARCVSAYAYVSCGVHESTTDVVFSGHSIITENGSVLAENKRFERDDVLLFADVDIERLKQDRTTSNSWTEQQRQFAALLNFRTIEFALDRDVAPEKMARQIDAHPFVPRGEDQLRARCEEIDNMQVAGLVKRLESAGVQKATIGVSGGLDSTRALQVAVKAFDMAGLPRTSILGYTMPGFGTSDRSKGNAHALMTHLGITDIEVDIRAMCFEQWRAEKYSPFGIDLEEILRTVRREYLETLRGAELTPEALDVDFTALAVERFHERLRDLPEGAADLRFENTQARMRTKILMDNGFVIGTGDLSELALGWCTYNGDHMSMYNVNCSIPKTLVKFLVHWAAKNQFDGEARKTLLDIVGTEISPELLPTGRDGKVKQKTEKVVGPYELHDFFLYHMLRFGMTPEKIFYLAKQAEFRSDYTDAELRHWLRAFYTRFFNSQFKRSCVPDGPKVGSISLSPRGDWRMPSDSSKDLWISMLDDLDREAESHKEELTMTTSNEAVTAGATTTPVVRAHVIVDAINAFGSKEHGGELPVPEGEMVGPEIGRLQDSGNYAVTVAGNDNHPFDMFNFAEVVGEGVTTVKDANGNDAHVYPRHAVKGTRGAEFLPGVNAAKIDRVFPKGDCVGADGERINLDSYSACGNPALVPYLREKGVTDVDVTGLVFRICVGSTAIDLVKAGFRVRVIVDATRDLAIDAFQPIIDEMKALGVEFVNVADVLA